MRVALIGPVYPYRGGIAHYTTMLYQALTGAGHDVLLISFKRLYPRWLYPGESDKDPSQDAVRVESAQSWIDSLNPCTWLSTALRLRRYKPDLVIQQWWSAFLAPAWIAIAAAARFLRHGPWLTICHNVLPHEKHRLYVPLARAVLSLATHFIVSSSAEKQQLLALLPAARVLVSPLPLFGVFGAISMTRDAARSRLELPPDAKVMLFFGIIRAYKGLTDLLHAMPRIISGDPRSVLLVAGEFWDEKAPYLLQVDALHIADHVIFDDRYIPNEEVPALFAAADVLVAPYRSATGSAAVQVARAYGLPVVVTWETESADSALLVRAAPGDAASLAEACLQALELPNAVGSSSSGRSDDSWSELTHAIVAFTGTRGDAGSGDLSGAGATSSI